MKKHTSPREPTVEEHIDMKRHKITEEEVKLLAGESNAWWRKIREAVDIL